jgi:large subunit ribosomal protein L21
MFAVIRTGGKQYRVAAEDKITVMSLAGEPGDRIMFEDVLFAGKDGSAEFGPKVKVTGEIVAQARSPKSISFKKRRRQNSKRKRGHRQDLTIVRIVEIA